MVDNENPSTPANLDSVKKGLLDIVHDVALENWDHFETPFKLKDKIASFLNEQQKSLNLFKDFCVRLPVQDPKTKRISVNVELMPDYAAKNITIKLIADKDDKNCEDL